jgi:hypothetical protein
MSDEFEKLMAGDTVLFKLPTAEAKPDRHVSSILLKRNINVIWVPYNYEFVVVRKADD